MRFASEALASVAPHKAARNAFLYLFCLLLAAFPLFAEEGPQIIAHRCYNAAEAAPENSLEALQTALGREGLYGVEMDVWVTADGVVVVHHDGVIGTRALESLRYDELRDVRLPNGEAIPTLASFLEPLRTKPTLRAVIEIKEHARAENGLRAADAVRRLVREYGLEERVEYQSFDVAVCERLIAHDAAAVVGYPRGDLPPAELKARGFAIMDYHYGVLFARPSWIAEAQALGLRANVYTVNSYADMLHAANLGLDCLCTDFPEELRALLAWREESVLRPLVTHAPFTRALCALRNTPLALVYALQEVCGKAAGGPEADSPEIARFCAPWSGGILLLSLGLVACGKRYRRSSANLPKARRGAWVLSFCSPAGRVRPLAFWWRQSVLMLPLYFCTYAACLAGQGGMSWLGDAAVLSVLLSQFCPPALFASGLACLGVHYAGGGAVIPELCGLLCLLLSLLAAWCSFALVLRRLRDTRPGLWLFPLCLTLPWVQFIMLTKHRPVWADDALLLLVFGLATLCLCLPSRRS